MAACRPLLQEVQPRRHRRQLGHRGGRPLHLRIHTQARTHTVGVKVIVAVRVDMQDVKKKNFWSVVYSCCSLTKGSHIASMAATGSMSTFELSEKLRSGGFDSDDEEFYCWRKKI